MLFNKRFLCVVVFVMLLLANIPFVSASFPDVDFGHDNYDAILYVQEQDIVSGYPDGTYKPDITINRAEFTKIVINSNFNSSVIENCVADNVSAGESNVFFPDVPKSEWFAKYICVAKMNNIIGGYPDGTFKPANQINFVEAAKIIVNTFGATVGQEAVWYKPYVENLANHNAIPTSISSFDESVTRGEMAEMIYRLLAGITDKDSWTYDEIESGAAAQGSGSGAVNANRRLYFGKWVENFATDSFPIYALDCFTSDCEAVQLWAGEWTLNTKNRLAFDTTRDAIIYPRAAGVFQLETFDNTTGESGTLGFENTYGISYLPAVYGDTLAAAVTTMGGGNEIVVKFDISKKIFSEIDAFKEHMSCSWPAVSSTGLVYAICRDEMTLEILDENGVSYYSVEKSDVNDGLMSLEVDLNGNGYFVEDQGVKKINLATKAVTDITIGSGYEVATITITPYADYLAGKALKDGKWDIFVREESTGTVTVPISFDKEPGIPSFGPLLFGDNETGSDQDSGGVTGTTLGCSDSEDLRDAIVVYLTADTDEQKLACLSDYAKNNPDYLLAETNLSDVQPGDDIRGIDSFSAEVDVYYWYGTSTTPVTKIFTMTHQTGKWLINAIVQQ